MTLPHTLEMVPTYVIRRHRHLRTVLPVLFQTETSRNEAAGHRVKDFPTVDLKGNEDEILRSNCLHCILSCISIDVKMELNKQSNCILSCIVLVSVPIIECIVLNKRTKSSPNTFTLYIFNESKSETVCLYNSPFPLLVLQHTFKASP